jgi:myo-inositol 2-dehydrogenase / D-chiro-inositol 1-dehydrogenase
MTIGIGIIGAGIMGAGHARILASGVSGAQLVGLCDFDRSRAELLAEECRARMVFENPQDLINASSIDAIVIVSPDETHGDLLKACVAARKPVLCEKPLAASVEECRSVVDCEVAGGTQLIQVGYMRRFDPGYVAMQQALAVGDLGDPIFLRFVHRNAIAPHFMTSELVFTNAAVHEIDIARFLLREEIVNLSVVSPRASRIAPSRQAQLLILETESGIVVDVELFLDAQYGYDVRAEAVCEKGTVSLSPFPPVSFKLDGHEGYRVETDWRARFSDAYRSQMASWIASIQTGNSAGANAWDGYIASLVARYCLDAVRKRDRIGISVPTMPDLYR